MSRSVAGDVARPLTPQESAGSNQASLRPLWKEDLEKLRWKVGDAVHKMATTPSSDSLDGVHLEDLLIVSRFPRSDIAGNINQEVFLVTSKSTQDQRWVFKTPLPNLFQLLSKVYGCHQSRVASANSSSGDESIPTYNANQPFPDDLIGSVAAVRYDVLNDGSAAYLVEWKILPEMNGETLGTEWVGEKDMPERWVEAHEFRRTSDVWEYGPIDIPTTVQDSMNPLKPMPALPESPNPSLPLSPSPKPFAAPPNSQPFPLSPPRLPSYMAPSDDRSSALDDSEESSDEDLPAVLSAMLAKTKPSQSQPSQPTTSQRPRRSVDTRPEHPQAAPTSKPPSVVIKKEKRAAASSGPEPEPSGSSRKKKQTTTSPGILTSQVPNAAPSSSNTTTGAKPSAKAQDKRKAHPAPASSPPAKRHRARHTHVHPRKYDEFWYLDGNIIVQIEDTRFKLHRSRLTLQSEFFEELFDHKDGPGEIDIRPELVDGHPFYVVSGVSADDFANMLHAMDNAITYCFETTSFTIVASILRVATTLSFTQFRVWAVRCLETMWSSDLAHLSADRIPNAVETVVLGRECDVPGVLKRALYELLRTGGFGTADASQDEGPALSKADSNQLIHAREKLIESWTETLASATRDFSQCPNTVPNAGAAAPIAGCTADLATKVVGWSKLVYESGMLQEYMYNVLGGLEALVDHDWKRDGFCDECVRKRRRAWRKQREKLWDNLDIYLEIADMDST